MQEQNSFPSFTSLFVWPATQIELRLRCCGKWPDFALVTSNNQYDRPWTKGSLVFFKRRIDFEHEGPDKYRRNYHISRSRSVRRPGANRMINENIKSNDRHHEEERHEDRELGNKNIWQAWKNGIGELFVNLPRLITGFRFAARRVSVLFHDQSIWLFQQRRIQRAIGLKAPCAVLSQRKVLIVSQGEVITCDSVLLALKSHALSELLQSVERGKLTFANSRQSIRQAEYRLDRWWPPYI